MINKIKLFLVRIFVIAYRMIHGVDPKTVLFTSFNGSSYSDNPRAISEVLHHVSKEINICWIINEDKEYQIPAYARKIPNADKISVFKSLSTSGIVISNFSLPYIPKSKKQFFVQTWHGDRAFKKVLYDAPNQIPGFFVSESKAGYCDLAVAGSKYGEQQFRSAFKYKGEILLEGTPRDDVLVMGNNDRYIEVKKKLGLKSETKLLLFAPTLRKATQNTSKIQKIQELNVKATIESVEEKHGGKWICLLRAHPSVIGLDVEYDGNLILDVSTWPDMSDLLLISDILITDYSSCAGDFALLHRPIFLFQPDADEYIKNERTLYFNLDDSPYIIAKSQNELNELIRSTSLDDAAKNCNEILDFYGTKETGHAAETVARRLIDHCRRISR